MLLLARYFICTAESSDWQGKYHFLAFLHYRVPILKFWPQQIVYSLYIYTNLILNLTFPSCGKHRSDVSRKWDVTGRDGPVTGPGIWRALCQPTKMTVDRENGYMGGGMWYIARENVALRGPRNVPHGPIILSM